MQLYTKSNPKQPIASCKKCVAFNSRNLWSKRCEIEGGSQEMVVMVDQWQKFYSDNISPN